MLVNFLVMLVVNLVIFTFVGFAAGIRIAKIDGLDYKVRLRTTVISSVMPAAIILLTAIFMTLLFENELALGMLWSLVALSLGSIWYSTISLTVTWLLKR